MAALCLVDKKRRNLKPAVFHEFTHQLRVDRLKENLNLYKELLPGIELLIFIAGKEIPLLALSLKVAIQSSMNRINKITTISPKEDVQACYTLLSNIETGIFFQALDEKEVIGELDRNRLKTKFGNRYG